MVKDLVNLLEFEWTMAFPKVAGLGDSVAWNLWGKNKDSKWGKIEISIERRFQRYDRDWDSIQDWEKFRKEVGIKDFKFLDPHNNSGYKHTTSK
ncbi:MAG: hypothetical protein AABW88_00100 [Nanoarchaeota archaeon]